MRAQIARSLPGAHGHWVATAGIHVANSSVIMFQVVPNWAPEEGKWSPRHLQGGGQRETEEETEVGFLGTEMTKGDTQHKTKR